MKKRRKTRKYKTGIHVSKKSEKEIHYRSGWEKSFCDYLDNDPNVVSYEYENVIISYLANAKSGKTSNYYPDFYVHRVDGSNLLIEIKPKRFLNRLRNKKKWDFARKWCVEHNAEFMVLTEEELSAMDIL